MFDYTDIKNRINIKIITIDMGSKSTVHMCMAK